jgi:hypothetical protein
MNKLEFYRSLKEAHSPGFDGWYHQNSEAQFLKASAFLKEHDTGIDAGCYVGDNAFAMAAFAARVLTFEPDFRLRAKMEARLSSGEQGAGRIKLFPDALGKEDGTVEFQVVNDRRP